MNDTSRERTSRTARAPRPPCVQHHWKRARALVGDHAGENIEPAGRAFGIDGGDRSIRCRAA